MNFFQYQNNRLYAEQLPVQQLAEQFGTPLYIYSRATLERHWHAFNDALGSHPHLICFAVKSCSNIGVLSVMAKLGSGLILSRKANWNAYWWQVVRHRKSSFPVWQNLARRLCVL
ncbi:diaminopimelate decarboxylase [Rodentibacter pneumotropicus]|uniref:Diaminopimelate decarboxylase n=1 Tax=Rodentibacter pneumotropicus TaxID=758 RepID=A0A448MIB0_9PAST|nr:diaminopimelate decarboxylase [Rodentibacter pneumotropicus]